MNGVYENAVLTALKNHSNLSEVILCVDNDEGGIEAVDRLKDILNENGYSNVKRLAPPYKDWNEVLKAKNGVYALPAVPNQHKEEYHRQYTDKGKKSQKQRNLQECVQTVLKDLRQTARTREQSVNTAKLLYQLADSAVRLSVEETLNAPMQENIESEDIVSEPEPCMEFS